MKRLLIVFAVALFLYSKPIIGNMVIFHPDEMYWIGTGRIVPLLLARDTRRPFWDEYYGYANFNGAKLLYGVGLTIMGHTDYRPLGLPPDTYYRFEHFRGKPFPADYPLFPMLRDGRLISALFGAAAVGLIFVWARAILGSTLGSALSAVVFAAHPIMMTVTTHAYADSFFVFFIIVILVTIHHYMAETSSRSSLWWVAVVGVMLALLVSVKMNGFLFLFPIIFAILHPNFFFFPTHGPLQIIEDRMRITRDHMVYFDEARYYVPLLPYISFLVGGSVVAINRSVTRWYDKIHII